MYGDIVPHIWNFGLRPIFDPLYLMSTKIDRSDRIKIKRQFNNILFEMFKSYIGNFKPRTNPFKHDIEYTYILKKTIGFYTFYYQGHHHIFYSSKICK